MCLRSGNLRDKIEKKWLEPWLLELAKFVERSHSEVSGGAICGVALGRPASVSLIYAIGACPGI
jgi:hypothetical protein